MAPSPLREGVDKIKHIIIVLQENRSFDHYFGTFPGADGIPMSGGRAAVCVPNPKVKAGCSRPFHLAGDSNKGGPHTYEDAIADINGGKMDGFILRWHASRKYCLEHPAGTTCRELDQRLDVIGYHDAREIPNYWTYAQNFVLQDHMFEPNLGWSEPAHLYVVSGWSAVCRPPGDPAHCENSVGFVDVDTGGRFPNALSYWWTDITYLLNLHGVSWRYFVAPKTVFDCDRGDMKCSLTEGTPEIWNPLPDFATVHENDQLGNIQEVDRFFEGAGKGTLPSVSWVLPDWKHSEHPPWTIREGQAWVTDIVNAVMQGPDWESSAILLAWDDWGGFYDHVPPPQIDGAGYGLRVPGLLISPYAKRGYIDHQTLSFDAYLKFIEDVFLDGQRLDPFTNGRPDPRPVVRERVPELGDILAEFDFDRPPQRPLVLARYPLPGPASSPT